MKLLPGEPPQLQVSGEEAVRLGLVSLIFLHFEEGMGVPCGPSHWFCQAAAEAPNRSYLSVMNDSRKAAKVARRHFSESAVCPMAEEGLSAHEVGHWVNAALSLTMLTDETIRVVYELGITIGGRPSFDA